MKTILCTLFSVLFSTLLFSQVTLSGALSGDFTDLSQAFAAIQSGGGTGTVNVAITADITTTQTALLEDNGYRVIIRPVGQRILIITTANLPLIHLNNARHVFIDGVALSGENTLTLTSWASGNTAPVILLENDAAHNRISNCTVRGGTITNTSQFNGLITLANNTGDTGCDQDTISGNIIRERFPFLLPFIGITMIGRSAAVTNDDCLIEGNQIVNIFNPTGISDGVFSRAFNRGTIIIGNHFYQTANRLGTNSTMAPNMRAIEITNPGFSDDSGGFVIRDNWIGGTAPFCGGAALNLVNPSGPAVFFGIFAHGGNSLTRIDGNHIANLDLSFRDPTSPNWYFFMGISIAGGNVELGVQEGNYIGSDTSDLSIILRCRKVNTGTVLCTGINDQGSSSITIANNRIGGISLEVLNTNDVGLIGLVGINTYLGGGVIRDNLIGSTTVMNSIEVNNVVQDVEIDAIAVEGGTYTVERNRIQGIRNLSGYALTGIRLLFGEIGVSTMTCKHNYISDLHVPLGSDIDLAGIAVLGYEFFANTNPTIESDTIRNLSIGSGVTGKAFVTGITFAFNAGFPPYFAGGLIKNNVIENLNNLRSGNSTGCAGIVHRLGFKTELNITGNIIRNFQANSAGLSGIVISPETNTMLTNSLQRVIIDRNTIYGLTNNHTGAVSVTGVEVAGRQPLVTANRLWDLQTPHTTSSESLVAGLLAFDIMGTQSSEFQNNMVALDHSTHGSAQAAGIYSAVLDGISNASVQLSFNSVYIGGSSDAASTAFLREGTDLVSLRNNIFYNDCGGSGLHTAIANIAATPTTNWPANASDHNYLVSRDPEALNVWGSEPQNISTWQSAGSSDLNSHTRIAGVSSFSDLLFADKNAANLDLLLDNPDEVLVLQNAGLPVTGITEDFFGNPRDPNTPDIGAREFATIVQVGEAGIPETEITVSPNPTTDFIDLLVSADAPAEYSLQLTDAQGKVLLQLHITETAGFQKRISLQELPAGVYVLIVANKGGVATRQIIKR